MEATVVNFRRGRHRQYNNQLILEINGYNKEKAKHLIGKKVSWVSPGKLKRIIMGQIKSTHGNKGTVRAYFERGLPGQIIGKKVSWISPGKLKRIINGQIKSAHGNKGAVRASFERGLPGQIIGKKVTIE